MAKFTHGPVNTAAAPFVLEDDGRTVVINRKGTKRLSVHQTRVTVVTEQGSHEHENKRDVYLAPHGAKALPYFRRDGAWYVVMVEQFRIALPGKTLEAPGGEADEADVSLSMARELQEEVRVKVDPVDITIVYGAYIQPSMMRSKAYGGIVEIDEADLPRELVGGEHQFGEYTVIAVHPLAQVLRQRDEGTLTVDLETWLLLDAVAKLVGIA